MTIKQFVEVDGVRTWVSPDDPNSLMPRSEANATVSSIDTNIAALDNKITTGIASLSAQASQFPTWKTQKSPAIADPTGTPTATLSVSIAGLAAASVPAITEQRQLTAELKATVIQILAALRQREIILS